MYVYRYLYIVHAYMQSMYTYITHTPIFMKDRNRETEKKNVCVSVMQG